MVGCAALAFGLLVLEPLDAVSRFGPEALLGRSVRLMFDTVILGSMIIFLPLAVVRRPSRHIPGRPEK